MGEIGSLFVRVGADTSNFDRGMGQVKSSLVSTDSMLSRFASGVGSAFKVAGAVTFGAAALIGGAVAKTGVEFNALKEQADIAFTTMLGSGEKAKSFLDDLQKFAAKTPFEFPDLLQNSQRLLAMGFAADEIMPTMTAIGDAVAGLGGGAETIGRVTTAFGQMNAKGKASGEEMMQLTEAGIPAWEFLAKKIGVDIPEAMKMVTKGAVSADTAIAAVTEGMTAKFGGMMEKQSATRNGLVSTLKDIFTQLSGKVMKPIFDGLGKGLKWLVDFTSSPQFTAGIDRFVERITRGFEWVSSAIKRFASLFSLNISVLTSENASWGEKMVAVWDMVSTVGLKIWDALLANLLKLLPQWLEGLVKWAKALWTWIVESTPKAIAALWEWAKGLWGWLVTNLPTWMANLWEWAKATWQWIVDVTPAAVAAMLEWGRQLLFALNTFFFGLGPEISGLWIIVTNIFTAAYALITGQWNIFWSALENGYRAFETLLLPTLQKWATALWQWIVTATPVALTKLGEWATALGGWITTNVPRFVTALRTWAVAAWQWIVDAIPDLVTALEQWGGALWQWLIANGPTWLGPLGEWTVSAWQWIASAIAPVVTQLNAWGGAIWNWLNANGPTWTNRLTEWGAAANGFIAAIGQIVTTIGTIFGPIAQAVTSFVTWKDVLIGSALALGVIFAPAIIGAIGAALTPLAGFVAAWAPVLAIFAVAILATAGLRTAWENDWLGIQTKTGAAIGYLQERFGPLVTTIRDFGVEALTEIAAWATGTDTDFSAVNTIVGKAKETFGLLWADFKTNFPATATAAETAWKSVSDNTKIMFDYVSEKTSGLTQAIKDFGVDSLIEIGKWVTGQETDFESTKTIWNEFSDLVTDVSTDLLDVVLPPLVEWLSVTFPEASNDAGIAMGILEQAFTLLSTAASSSTTSVGKDYSAFIDGLKMTLDAGFGLMLIKTSAFVANFALSLMAADAAIRRDWDGMWLALDAIQTNHNKVQLAEAKFQGLSMYTLMNAAGKDVATGFGKGVDEGAGGASDSVGAMSDGITGSFERALMIHSPSVVFKGYGTNVVEGFEDGFKDRWGQFKTTTNSTVTSWMNWFKNVFGIHSPSTVFAEHGTNIVAGLAKGISGAQDMVYGAMGDLSAGMNANMSTSMDYAYAASDTGASEDVALMRENNQLLRTLIAALQSKNMTANVTVAGGGENLGAVVSYATAGRGY